MVINALLFKICLKEKKPALPAIKFNGIQVEFYNQTFISNGVDWVLKSKSVSANPNMNDVSKVVANDENKNNEKTQLDLSSRLKKVKKDESKLLSSDDKPIASCLSKRKNRQKHSKMKSNQFVKTSYKTENKCAQQMVVPMDKDIKSESPLVENHDDVVKKSAHGNRNDDIKSESPLVENHDDVVVKKSAHENQKGSPLDSKLKPNDLSNLNVENDSISSLNNTVKIYTRTGCRYCSKIMTFFKMKN